MRFSFLAVACILGSAAISGAMTKAATSPAFAIQQVTLQAVPTLVKRATVKDTQVSAALAQILPQVKQFMQSHSIPANGAPFARYFTYETGGEVEMEAGFPAITQQPLEDGIVESSLPAGEALSLLYTGPYSGSAAAYDALHAWIADHHLTANGGPWEIYLNDPAVVAPEEVQTQIYYPVN
jgi:effector-binding domain-containing protein